MAKQPIKPRWATYASATQYTGLSSRLLEKLVKEKLIASSLVRRPGCARGIRLIDLDSVDRFIERGIDDTCDVNFLNNKSSRKGGRK
ncbi:hypothetical protein JIN84_21530 [Luteolibacter yonseiensis]|uniref:Uncharacterized protein n=1 Tax=Luteolibacter yonseiensis TaxID=1144680 RepID=A0A934R9Z5_9BACT|nr:hypothetical protein [Luteolibacter yonseiensis]MBK1818220.1 hypothetical protein [Luteolibacter yonseiensis]